MSLSGFQFKMHHKILHKLRKAGASSIKSSVTIEEADFDYQEQMWLDFFAGAFLGKIKKTEDRRYYKTDKYKKIFSFFIETLAQK